MNNLLPTLDNLKATIERLIKAGTSFDVDELENIYHDDLEIIIINDKKDKIIADKKAFKNIFTEKKNIGAKPLNTWCSYNHLNINGVNGHVIVTRKVNLTGKERTVIVNIDLIWQNNSWQVVREVITD